MTSPRFRVEHPDSNVHVVRCDIKSQTSWDQWFLLRSDAHHDNPDCDREMEYKHLDQAMQRGAGILDAGDLFCAMQGKYDRRSDKSKVRPEHQCGDYLDALVRTAAEDYAPYAKNWILMGQGNHECLDGETEVLTESGWVPIAAVTAGTPVAVMHPYDQTVHFANPIKTHSYDYSGKMFHFCHRGMDMMVTPNHRLVYYGQGSGALSWQFAEDFCKNRAGTVLVPTCGFLADRPGCGLSDSEIRLAAWFMTDGSIDSRVIYQSKPEMVERIRNLLVEMGLEFRETSRDRDTKSIMGVELKSKPLRSYEFKVASSENIMARLGVVDKTAMPSWVTDMDQRQFDLFLSELVLGDGSRSRTHTDCSVLYGTPEFLSNVQAVAVLYGYRARLCERKRTSKNGTNGNYYALNLVPRGSLSVSSKAAVEVDYTGKVYCLTTQTGNFFCRRNGKPFLTGNSSILEKHETNLLDRLVHDIKGRAKDTSLKAGGYGGFVRFMFTRANERSSVRMSYFHGSGGGGPVTRGVIQTNRRSAMIEADIYWSGHVHEKTLVATDRAYLNDANVICQRRVEHVCTPGYKDEYHGGKGGWWVGTGKGPRRRGAAWLRFYWDRGLTYEILEAQ
jgi:hypothetical protein